MHVKTVKSIGVAIIKLHTENGSQQLAEELVSRPFKAFALDVTNFTPDRITLLCSQMIKKGEDFHEKHIILLLRNISLT